MVAVKIGKRTNRNSTTEKSHKSLYLIRCGVLVRGKKIKIDFPFSHPESLG